MIEKENTRHKANIRASHFLDRYDGELNDMDKFLLLPPKYHRNGNHISIIVL
jgi:hypothetical protein